MATTTLKTKTVIDFNTWIEQAQRFATIENRVIANNLPKSNRPTTLPENIITHGEASISVVYDKPLEHGFEGLVTYTQHYQVKEKKQNYEEQDGVLVAEGEPTLETVDKTHKIIEYYEIIDAATIEYLLDRTLSDIPSTITGYFARQKAAIDQIILDNVVRNSTFNLAAEQWQLTL